MASTAVQYEGAPGSPPWGDVRHLLLMWGEVCAAAAVTLAVRGPRAVHAAMAVRQASDSLRDIGVQLQQMRCAHFDEAIIQAERERAYQDGLAAAGLVPPQSPPQRPRHLHAVS